MPEPAPRPDLAAVQHVLAETPADARAVCDLIDVEQGFPRVATETLAGTPIPDGAPRTTLHAVDPEPVSDGEGKLVAYACPLPRQPLPPDLADRVLIVDKIPSPAPAPVEVIP